VAQWEKYFLPSSPDNLLQHNACGFIEKLNETKAVTNDNTGSMQVAVRASNMAFEVILIPANLL